MAPGPNTYLKDHLAAFTEEELATAYSLAMPIDEARAQAAYAYSDPDGRVFAGDTFLALATVSDDAARRVAQLIDVPLEVVLEARDELLSTLGRLR